MKQNPELSLLLGHGSGSFGHVPAKLYGTRNGVSTVEEWRGFSKVWVEARTLNQIVIQHLVQAGLPVIAISPSSAIITNNGVVTQWDTTPIQKALSAGLIPVVYGDVIFDQVLGGTILSTEELFYHLAQIFSPGRILISGIEPGVFSDYPLNSRLISEISPVTYPAIREQITQSAAMDVTGGMATKVENLVSLVTTIPGLDAWIFPGSHSGSIEQALIYAPQTGSWIHA